MSKPLAIVAVGTKFKVVAYGEEVKRRSDGKLDVSRNIKGKPHVVTGEVATFTQEDAEHVAHQVGRYMFGLGDFVYSYCEGVTEE